MTAESALTYELLALGRV